MGFTEKEENNNNKFTLVKWTKVEKSGKYILCILAFSDGNRRVWFYVYIEIARYFLPEMVTAAYHFYSLIRCNRNQFSINEEHE